MKTITTNVTKGLPKHSICIQGIYGNHYDMTDGQQEDGQLQWLQMRQEWAMVREYIDHMCECVQDYIKFTQKCADV